MPKHRSITDEELLEAVFRADRLLNAADGGPRTSFGEVEISTTSGSLDIFVGTATALTFWKPHKETVNIKNIRDRCNWSPSLLEKALNRMRELMILEDLADV